jgi:Holliday junction resolvase YEN1
LQSQTAGTCLQGLDQAPGEAEAELAYLNDTGAIDVVITDDSDVLLFGAKQVIRK